MLCGAGALLARPFVALVSRYAARFSVRALDVTVDASLLWIGAGLAMTAAVVLAYVPRLPSPHAPTGLALASGGVRALVASVVISRRLSTGVRPAVMVASILLACAVFTLIRTGGISGDGDSDLHWRWTPSAEERLLALAADAPPIRLALPVSGSRSSPMAAISVSAEEEGAGR